MSLPTPSADAPVEPTTLRGNRWALALGSALLLIFALAVSLRWTDSSPQHRSEEVVQQPVANTSPSPRQEVSAPDPGDNP